ncbi:protein of unknown function [Burkholderia multivorans]
MTSPGRFRQTAVPAFSSAGAAGVILDFSLAGIFLTIYPVPQRVSMLRKACIEPSRKPSPFRMVGSGHRRPDRGALEELIVRAVTDEQATEST